MEKLSHHERIDRVGRALYGEYWIGELGTRELKVARVNSANHYPTRTVTLPSTGKEATKIAQARFRARASDEQNAQIIRWLEEQRKSEFDPLMGPEADFEAWFRKQFPDAPLSSTEKRKAVVLALWNSGRRPGRHGNMAWSEFYALVREQSGQQCEDRTIERDVAELVE